MEFKVKVLLTRYGPPPPGPPEPSLTVFHTRGSWDEFVKAHDGAREGLAKLSINWSISVLLLVRTVPEGGMDLFPSIVSLSRDGDVTRVEVAMTRNPDAQMLDVVVQPWLLAEAPAQAFGGDPNVQFTVKEQPPGRVFQQR